MRNMSKMAKLVLILLIVTIASFVIAGVIFYAEYGSNNFTGLDNYVMKPANSVDIDVEKTQSVTGISNIYVNTTSDNVNIIKTDSNELKAHFHGYYSSNDKEFKPEFTVTTSGGEIRIKVDYKPHIGMLVFNSNLKLDVYLPASYTRNLDIGTSSANVNIDQITSLEGFKCKTTSGSLRANLVNAGKAELGSSSGSTSINGTFGSIVFHATSGEFTTSTFDGIKAKTASFETSSGSIKLNITADELNLHSTSGEIVSNQVTAQTCTATASSGRIELKGNPGRLEANTTSGEVNLEYNEYASDVNVGTSSGSVRIKLPQDAQFHLTHRTSSGGSNIDFPVTISGSSERRGIDGTVLSDRNTINVTTSSGSLNITK